MDIITGEQLKNLASGQHISGIVLIKDYKIQLTRQGKEYITGQIQSDIDMTFKAWGSSGAFGKLKSEAYENMPSYITAVGDDYGGTKSLVLDTVQAVDGYTPDQFFPIKYNIDAYWETLKKTVASAVTPKGLDICNKVLFENAEVAERFKAEFAARSHHDNCKGGLLAHTYKVVGMVTRIISLYPGLIARNGVQEPNMSDLLYIGALLHDVGKCFEMTFGVYTPSAIVKHQYLGAELIAKFKDDIIAAYDENWYYSLISILLQHHGEFGESPKTVVAQVIHLADVFDAHMTDILQAVEAINGEGTIRYEGEYLSI